MLRVNNKYIRKFYPISDHFKDIDIFFVGIVENRRIHEHKITKSNFRDRKSDITDVARSRVQIMPHWHSCFEAGNSVYELVIQ